MEADREALQVEPAPLSLDMLGMEAVAVNHSSSDTNLWNAVLLQLIKEAENIRRGLQNTKCVLDNPKSNFALKTEAFDDNWKMCRKKREVEKYIKSSDFFLLCDYAGHNEKCVGKKIQEVLDNKCAIADNQVKRTFSRKPDPKRK